MGTILLIIIAVIIFFALVFAFFSPKEERGEAAAAGAVYGISWLVSIIPTVIVISLIVLVVKSCS